MDDSRQPGLRAGAGDAFAKAFEMVATPAVFGLLGWFADSRIGVFPAFTLAVVFVVFGYQMWRLSCNYSAAMDDALRQRRASYASSVGVDGDGDPRGPGRPA